jgi:hypothetical protein
VVFGVLAVARVIPNGFTSGECEFLRQLSEHAALAARLNEPDFWAQHAAESAQLSAQLEELEAATLQRYARWEELEAVRAAAEK